MWYKWVLCKWPVFNKPHLPPSRVQVKSCVFIHNCKQFSLNIFCVSLNTCTLLFSLLVCMCVCRCSPGWAGHRCESVATADGVPSSGGRKLTLLLWNYRSSLNWTWLRLDDNVCMCLCVCVRRHSLYSDPCAATVAAGSAGCRSVVLVQKEDERVSNSNAFKTRASRDLFLPLYSVFFSLFLSFPLFRLHLSSPLCNGVSSAPQV